MRKKLWLQEEKNAFFRMFPYALPLLCFYLSDNFCYAYATLFQTLHGFSTQTVGTVGGIASVLTIFAEMIFSRISDASRSVKRASILCTSLTAIFSLMICVFANWKVLGFPLVLLILCIRNTIVTPTATLMDNWVLRSSYQEKFEYGTAKSAGVAGGVVGSFLTTAVMLLLCKRMDQTRATEIFYLIGFCLMTLMILSMLPLHDAPAAEKAKVNRKSLNPMRLFKNKQYMLLAIMYCLSSLVTNPCNVFLSVVMTDHQMDPAKLGIIWGLQSVLQFPILLTFAKLKKRFPLHIMAAVGTVLCGVTSILRGNSYSIWMLVIAAMFYGVSFSLQSVSAANYIYELVPTELRGTGQSYYIVFGSLGSAIGVTMAGYLISAWGIQRFYSTAGIAAITVGVLYFLGTRMLQNAPKETV